VVGLYCDPAIPLPLFSQEASYFYAIFVAVRSLVPGENLPGTPSLILMYTLLHLTLGFYTSFYRFLRNDALQGTLASYSGVKQ
jgi:hypothetical protein